MEDVVAKRQHVKDPDQERQQCVINRKNLLRHMRICQPVKVGNVNDDKGREIKNAVDYYKSDDPFDLFTDSKEVESINKQLIHEQDDFSDNSSDSDNEESRKLIIINI